MRVNKDNIKDHTRDLFMKLKQAERNKNTIDSKFCINKVKDEK